MIKSLYNNLLVLLLVAFLSPLQLQAAEVAVESASQSEWQAAVAMQKYLIWQKINEARRNPLEVLDRLEIPFEQAQAVFGEDAAILTDGLPPLAWNVQLDEAATLHARDMINHLYYSHTSLDGSVLMERIAETGYQAVTESETLGALLFLNPVELDRGVSILLDNIMRDELTGAAGVSRNVFSSELTEVAVSFNAEMLPTLFDQPFVYLVVIDFAKPVTPHRFLVGHYDADGRVMILTPFVTGVWNDLPLQVPGLFQIDFPVGGAQFVVVDSASGKESVRKNLYDDGSMDHALIDLRREQQVVN